MTVRLMNGLATALLTLVACLPGMPLLASGEPSDLVLVLDASGSMWGQIEGENKIVIARRVLGELIDGIEAGRAVGLVAYGHRRESDCADIETVLPVAPLDHAALKAAIDALNPKGKTPITASLEQALALARERGGRATVLLVSDGLETCGGDPCATVAAFKASGVDFVLHVIGFDVAGEDVSQLECAAQAGDGMFLGAENAEQLHEALEQAVALPVETPAGRLVVKAVAGGKLQDVAVSVTRAGSGETAGVGRTYADARTNPREIPLADGKYDVVVRAIGLKGAVARNFAIEIAAGSTLEREFDFSNGELSIGATRNGELSDGLYHIYVAGTREVAAQGRTYRAASSNPATVKLLPGDYDVELGSIEIEGRPNVRLGTVTVEPGKRAELRHAFTSGSLGVSVARAGALVDATVAVHDVAGTEVARGRTYMSANSNPKTFVLSPGKYRVVVAVIKGPSFEREVDVAAQALVSETFEVP